MCQEKRCPNCDQVKSVTEFNKKKTAPDGLASWCRACNRAYLARSYRRCKSLKAQFLVQHGCDQCGEKDVRTLQFHHKDRDTKSFNIGSTATLNTFTLMNEMLKCQVLCANCHSKVSCEERNDWRQQYWLTKEAHAHRPRAD